MNRLIQPLASLGRDDSMALSPATINWKGAAWPLDPYVERYGSKESPDFSEPSRAWKEDRE